MKGQLARTKSAFEVQSFVIRAEAVDTGVDVDQDIIDDTALNATSDEQVAAAICIEDDRFSVAESITEDLRTRGESRCKRGGKGRYAFVIGGEETCDFKATCNPDVLGGYTRHCDSAALIAAAEGDRVKAVDVGVGRSLHGELDVGPDKDGVTTGATNDADSVATSTIKEDAVYTSSTVDNSRTSSGIDIDGVFAIVTEDHRTATQA